jgi:regulation of enolase protein 1 (concanavalin A-like superfamily)
MLLVVAGAAALFSGRAATRAQEAWNAADIGAVGAAGSTSVSNGVYTIRGAGEDIAGAIDAFHYHHRRWSGDGVFLVRVQSIEFTFNWAKAGIMIRSDLTAHAQHATAFVSPERNTSLLVRTVAGGDTSGQVASHDLQKAMPMWLKLTREGSSIAMDYSFDGVTWERRATATVEFPQDVYVGLIVNSHVYGTLCTAVFDNFTLDAVRPARVHAIARSPGSVEVRWLDHNLLEETFEVERSIDNVAFARVGTAPRWDPRPWRPEAQPPHPPPSFTDTSVAPNTTYHYRIRAVSPRGLSPYSSTVTATTPPPSPSGWSSADIGDTALTGRSALSGGVFTIAGAGSGVGGVRYYRESFGRGDFGADVAGYSDEFHYCWQSWTGAGEIVARVTGMSGSSTGHAGIMVRAGAGESAYNVFLHVNVGGGLGVTARPGATSGFPEYFFETRSYHTSAGVAVPTWLKLVRLADGVVCYASPDGASWAEVAWVGTPAWDAAGVQLGLAVSSRQDGASAALLTATFDNVAIGSPGAVPALPAPPTDLRVRQVLQTTVAIEWTNPTPLYDGVEVQSSSDGVTFITQITTLGSGYTAGWLEADRDYFFRIRTRRGDDASVWSPVLRVRTEPYPPPPGGLLATVVSDTRIQLTWTDNATNENGFFVEQSTDGIAFEWIASPPANATSHAVDGLSPGTTYYFRVIAYPTDMTKPRVYSNVASATTFALPPTGDSWQARDIGAVAAAGSSSGSGGTVTVRASGADIWNAADEFHYRHQPWSGDGTITVRVTGLDNTHGWAKAGVMFRETLDANSRHAMMIVSSTHGTALQYRSATGGASSTTTPTGSAESQLPRWLRLVRSGNTFTGYTSANGTTWVQAGSVTLSLPAQIYVGLAVTSHNDGVLATATFDNVALAGAGAPPPATDWLHTDVGSVGAAGSHDVSGGTLTVRGSGHDIWDAADGFHFVYRTVTGDCTIVARVGAITNTHAWAKAGVMIRESLAANARNTFVYLTPSSGLAAQNRASTGGTTSFTAGPWGLAAPYWIRLVRTGSSVVASASADGSNWTTVATYTVSLGTTVHVGLAVTSHHNGALATGTFSNVGVSGGGGTPIPTVPAAPSSLTATVMSGSRIDLNWTDGSANEDSFRIERATGGGSFTEVAAVGPNVTGYSSTGLSAGTTYAFRVRAANDAGYSMYSNTVTATTSAEAPPPAPDWSAGDIGLVALAGSHNVSGGAVTVRASGHDIWDATDGFHFVHRTLTGDGAVQARVVSLTNTHAWAKAGVMIRESLAANARNVFAFLTPANGSAAQHRALAGGATSFSHGPWGANPPYWVRLVRTGSTIVASASADGATWTTMGTFTVAMGSTVYLGLAVTSHDNSLLATATFDQVSITGGTTPLPPPPPPATWDFRDIGVVGIGGSNTSGGNTIAVTGAGADIWGAADAFRFVYRQLTGDGVVEAQVTSMEYTHGWAKAGVMIRESLDANARNAFACVTPVHHGVVAQARTTAGGETTSSAGPLRNAPYWVRLTRAGSTFTAAASPDGVTWTTYATFTIPMGATAYFGFAVTSHDATKLNTAIFTDPFVD